MDLMRPGGERGGILLVIAGLVLARAFDWLWIDPLADSDAAAPASIAASRE